MGEDAEQIRDTNRHDAQPGQGVAAGYTHARRLVDQRPQRSGEGKGRIGPGLSDEGVERACTIADQPTVTCGEDEADGSLELLGERVSALA